MTAAKRAAQPDPSSMAYADAVEELEQILEALEDDSVDVDQLASKVRRASEIIQSCRKRLTDSRTDIEQVVAELESFDEDPGDDEA